MKEKKQELELSFISESSGFKHKILDRATVNLLTKNALQDINGEDVEMKWFLELFKIIHNLTLFSINLTFNYNKFIR